MKINVCDILCILLFHLASSSCEDLGDVLFVLISEEEDGPFILEDNYCLDHVLPREQSSCRIRVLAPKNGVYSESRIWDMSLDFPHPSRPNTACHVRWPAYEDVRTWCEAVNPGVGAPDIQTETAKSGYVSFHDLIVSERKCDHKISNITTYKDGLNGYPEYEYPEQRPTVVFRTVVNGCVAGIVSGYRVNNYRTTEAPCVYNRRRMCRPLRNDQYDALIRDIEASDTYADFRTSSERPHLRP